MKLKEWLDSWSMTSLKIKAHFLEMEWKPQDVDKDAAWELYIELLTRITTQVPFTGTRRRKDGAGQHSRHIPTNPGDHQTQRATLY